MDRNELIQKVAYLTDNINKKTRAFRKEGLGKFHEYAIEYNIESLKDKANLIIEKSGFLTKSKKEIGKLSNDDLLDLYSRLQHVQTNDKYSTVKKFKVTEKLELDKSISTLKTLIGKEKFNKLKGSGSEYDLIVEFMKRKDELINSKGGTYVSAQIMNQMYLDIPNLTKDEKQDTERTVAKMERGRELMDRNSEQMGSRRKNGNR